MAMDVGKLLCGLEIDPTSTVGRRSAELLRLSFVRCPSGDLRKDELCRPLVCLELASIETGFVFDKEKALRLSGTNETAYMRAFSTIRSLMPQSFELNVAALCAQLECSAVAKDAEALLEAYKIKYKEAQIASLRDGLDFSKYMYTAAAVFLAAVKRRIKVSINKLLFHTNSRREEFDWARESMLKLCLPDLKEKIERSRARKADQKNSTPKDGQQKRKRSSVSGSPRIPVKEFSSTPTRPASERSQLANVSTPSSSSSSSGQSRQLQQHARPHPAPQSPFVSSSVTNIEESATTKYTPVQSRSAATDIVDPTQLTPTTTSTSTITKTEATSSAPSTKRKPRRVILEDDDSVESIIEADKENSQPEEIQVLMPKDDTVHESRSEKYSHCDEQPTTSASSDRGSDTGKEESKSGGKRGAKERTMKRQRTDEYKMWMESVLQDSSRAREEESSKPKVMKQLSLNAMFGPPRTK